MFCARAHSAPRTSPKRELFLSCFDCDYWPLFLETQTPAARARRKTEKAKGGGAKALAPPPKMTEERRSVVVIGAGLAGLRCAQLLKPYYPDVLVVEASPDGIGGRLKQVRDGEGIASGARRRRRRRQARRRARPFSQFPRAASSSSPPPR